MCLPFGCFWIVQESPRVVGGADFIHFRLVPAFDCGRIVAADFSIAEGKIAPVDALSAGGCGVQKQRVALSASGEDGDILGGNTRARCEAFGTSEVSMTPNVSLFDFKSSHRLRISFS